MMPQRSGSTFRGSTVIPAALAIVAVVVAGVFSVATLTNRRIFVEAAERQTHNLSAAVAMHAEQLFQRIDAALQGIERDLPPLSPHGAIPQKAFDILAEREKTSSNVLAFVVLDRAGRIAFTSRTPNPEKVDLSDREYFTVHSRGAGAGLHIGTPVVGRVGFSQGRWIVPASRRLSAPDGSFAGVVAAIVDVSSLTRFYDSIHLGSGAEIILARRDGTVLAHRSHQAKRIGASLAASAIFRDMVPRMEHGTVHGALFSDSAPLIASFSTAPSYPAVAVVAYSLSEALAPWKTAALEAGTIAFILTAGLCAAGIYLMRMSRREETIIRELAASEARYRSLFTGNHAVMLLIDPADGSIVDANPAACTYYGIPADSLTRMKISQINTADPAAIQSEMASAATGERRRFIFKHRLADGTIRDVEVFSGPIVIDGRELLYSIVFDITEKMEAEAEIRRLTAHLEDRVRERTAQLEAANQELEAFSYSVSHDLRAPLRHVAGFVELLLKRNSDGLDEKSRHYLDVIGDATRRMGSLIDDLLAFSRMGRVDMITAPLDLNRVVREVIATRETGNGQREIEWVVGTLPPARGDETMIRLVFENLIDNAVKFSAVRDRARIEIGGYLDSEGTPVAFVRDNGAGFDMRYEDKLFGLFQRLHRQEEFEGTGVGLANVRRIVHRHGGRVWAEGALDKGATFYLTLPPHKEAAP